MAVYPEDSCSQEGGMCLDKDECSEGKLLRRGLCKEQQKRGVECCAGSRCWSDKERRSWAVCERGGGQTVVNLS